MKPLIGITTGKIKNKHHPLAPSAYGQSHTYSDAIIHGGGAPVLLPWIDNPTTLREVYERLDGLFLAGGNDINPHLYGEPRHHTTLRVSTARDDSEVQLLEWALQDGKPILAVCRGMQLVNVVCGGNLHQDIKTDLPQADNHQSSTAKEDLEQLIHDLHIHADSTLENILQTDHIKTNSHHHQAVKEVGANLAVAAWAQDGIIEAIESTDGSYIIGIQSHPEALEAALEPRWQKLFTSFIVACQDTSDTYDKKPVYATRFKFW